MTASRSSLRLAILTGSVAALLGSYSAKAASGTWTQTTSGGLWSAGANWSGAVVADGSGFSADFSAIDITADNTVLMDAPHTLTSLVFGDTAPATAASWILTNNGNAANILTLAGAAPSITVNTLGAGKSVTISAVIAGSTNWSKQGLGTLVLSGANTYTGGTTISAGTLQVGNGGTSGSLGSGNIVDNGTLAYSFNSATTLSLPSSTLMGSGNVTATAGDIQLNGNISVGGSQSYTQIGGGGLFTGIELVAANTTLTGSSITLSGDVGKRNSDGNSLALDTSAANGTINLNISLGRAGVWYVPAAFTANAGTGTINVTGTGPSSSGWRSTPVTLTGAVNIPANVNSNAGVTINSTANGAVSGVFSGSMSLTKQGAGTLTLTGANTYSGGTTISTGTLQVGNGGTTGSLTGNIVDNGTLAYNFSSAATLSLPTSTLTGSGNVSATAGVIQFNGNITVGGSQTYVQSGAPAFFEGLELLAASTTLTGSSITLAGDVGDPNLPGISLTLNTSAANGPINLNISLGRNGVWYTPANFTANAGTGVVNVTGTGVGSTGWTTTAVALTGAMNITGNVIAGGPLTVTSTAPGSVSGVLSGAMSLTTQGASTLSLLNANTYTGATTINAGTLEIGATGAIASSPITVNAGTLRVDVTGKTLSSLTTNNSGAVLALPAVPGSTTTVSGAFTQSANYTVAPLFASLPVASATPINLLTAGSVAGAGAVTANFNQYGPSRVTGSVAINGNIVQLTIATGAANLIWNNAAGSGAWNVSGDVNFNNSGSNDVFESFDAVTFNDTATPGTVTLSGTLAPSSVTVNSVGNYVFAGTGSIMGAGSLTKSGTGTLTITTANSYAGPTTISGGTLQLGNGTTDGSISETSSITNNGALVYNLLGNQVYTGVISGSGTLTKTGPGSLTLTGADTYTGATTVSGGALTLSGAANSNSSSNIAMANGANLTFSIASGGGMFNKAITGAAGNVTFSVAGNTTDSGGSDGTNFALSNTGAFTGTVIINTGLVAPGADSAFGNASNVIELNASNGSSAGLVGTANRTLPNTRAIQLTTAGGNSIFRAYGATTFEIDGVISGAGNFVKTDSGTVKLTGANTFAGTTRVGAGTLNLANSLALQNSTLMSAGIIFDSSVGSHSFTLGGLSGAGNIALQDNAATPNAVALTVGNNSANTTYSGVLSAAGSLTKIGAGSLTLSGISTYAGATTVNAGTLIVAGSISGSAATVNSGATLTGAGGTTGAVTVQNGATIAPGSITSIGTLNTGSLAFNGGGTFSLAINTTAVTSSLDSVSGNLSLGATAPALNLIEIGGNVALPNNDTFSLITYTGTWDGNLFSVAGAPISNGGDFVFGANTFQLNYNGGAGNNTVLLTTIPESGPFPSLLGGLGLLAGLQRFRRRNARIVRWTQKVDRKVQYILPTDNSLTLVGTRLSFN